LEDRIEIGIATVAASQPGDGLGDRVVEQSVASRAFAPAEGPYTGTSLGQVHKLEVQREGGDDGLGVTEFERVQLGFETLPNLRLLVVTGGDRRLAQAFDEVVDRLAGLLRDDLPEQRSEQTDLEREWIARVRRADATRFGGSGRPRPWRRRGHATTPAT
jgi:hypothetical protein